MNTRTPHKDVCTAQLHMGATQPQEACVPHSCTVQTHTLTFLLGLTRLSLNMLIEVAHLGKERAAYTISTLVLPQITGL